VFEGVDTLGWIARAWKLFEVQQVQDAKVQMEFWRMN